MEHFALLYETANNSLYRVFDCQRIYNVPKVVKDSGYMCFGFYLEEQLYHLR